MPYNDIETAGGQKDRTGYKKFRGSFNGQFMIFSWEAQAWQLMPAGAHLFFLSGSPSSDSRA
jgi:hypothetical protein